MRRRQRRTTSGQSVQKRGAGAWRLIPRRSVGRQYAPAGNAFLAVDAKRRKAATVTHMASGHLPKDGDAVAVIDIGSNSGRVVVYRRDEAGMLRILSTTRAPLRLVSD